MTGDELWFWSQSAAALGLVVKLADRLIKLRVMTPGDMRELIDGFLLELEERQGSNPDLARYYEATKSHLETVLAGVQGGEQGG